MNRDVLEATNLDSAYFDEHKYLNNFLKTNNIKDLIQKNIEVQNDIKSFDHDIQSLVFENYNKFIISIDTVKKMKEDINKVDSKIKTLENSMNQINKLATTIDESLQTKRKEIQKLDTVNKDLQKLKNLCEFPVVLKEELAQYHTAKATQKFQYEKVFERAVENYMSCFGTLSRFKTEPLVKPLYDDSIKNLNEIRQILWNMQIEKGLSKKELRSITKKLIIVIEEKDGILKNYLKTIKDRTIASTKEIFDSYAGSKDDGLRPEEEQTKTYLEEKGYDINLNDFEDFKVRIQEEIAEKEKMKEGSCLWVISKVCKSLFPEINDEIVFLFQEILPIIGDSSSSSEQQGNDAKYREILESNIKEVIMGMMSSLSEKMSYFKISNMQVNESFKKINFEMQNILKIEMRRSIKTEITDRFSENIEQVFRGQLFNSFANLRYKLLELLIELRESCKVFSKESKETEADLEGVKKDLYSFLNTFKNKLYCAVCNTLVELKPFINSQDSFLKSHMMFFSLMHAQFTEFIKLTVKIAVLKSNKLSVEHVQMINSSVSNKNSSQSNMELESMILKLKNTEEESYYHLVINQYLVMFERKLLFKYFDALFDLNHKDAKVDLALKQQYQSLRVNIEKVEIPKIGAAAKTELGRNLVNYSEHYYEKILLLLQPYFKQKNWINCKEPRDISPLIERIVPLFKQILLELSILFPDLKRGIVKKNSFIKLKSSLDIDMERILVKKTHHFEKGEMNRNVLLLSILKSISKGIIENIRRIRFDKYGYQQLQVDMYFLVQMAFEMVAVDDESLVTGFYYEMIHSAMLTCVDATQLDQTIIETISSVKRSKLKF